MANTTSTFSKVMLLLKNKRALEGAGALGKLGALNEGDEEGEEEESDDEESEEDEHVGKDLRKSILKRAMLGVPKKEG